MIAIPVNVLMWATALLPIAFLLFAMMRLGWAASRAAPCSLLIAVAVALLLYRATPFALVVEGAKGVWNALVILLVVWPAIFLYEMSVEADAFAALRTGIQSITRHELLQIIILGWVFPSFLQGITGFGVAVAVGAPLLVGIGIAPVWSIAIVLLCHSWGATFGTLSLAWQALLSQTGIEGQTAALTALVACVIIWFYNFVGGTALCWFYGRGKALREGLPALLLISAIQGGGQLVLAQINHTVACFLPACAAMVAALLLSKTLRYRKSWRLEDSPIVADRNRGTAGPESDMGLHQSLLPYYVLTVVTVVCLLIPPVNALLGRWTIGFSFPGSFTGYGYTIPPEPFFSPLAPLTYAGTFLAVSTAVGYAFYKHRGSIGHGGLGRIATRTLRKTVPSSVAILSLIVMSKVMGGSGQIYVLSQGIASVLGRGYVLVAPLVGMLGAFVTSSNMSSNILFSSFQMTTAQLLSVSPALLLGAQTAGGVIGSCFSPGSVILGTSTTGISGQEGKIIKIVLPIALCVALLSGTLLFLTLYITSG